MYRVLCDGQPIHDLRDGELVLIDPKVTLEVNTAGSFEFRIPPTHPQYALPKKMKSVIQVFHDGEEIFAGRIVSDKADFYNCKDMVCEGQLAYLNDSVQRPHEYHGMTVRGYLEALLAIHNQQVDESRQFEVGIVTVTDSNDSLYRYTNYENTMAAIKEDLIDDLGGYIRVRNHDGHRYIDYIKDFDHTCTQTIQFGENLIDCSRNMDLTDIVTAIIPLGTRLGEGDIAALETRLTIESVNDGVDYLTNDEAVEKYGFIVKTVTWDDVTTPERLLSKGKRWLTDEQFENMVIDVKAVDLHYTDEQIEQFKLFDMVHVHSAPHGLDRDFPLSKMELHLTRPSSDTFTLGTIAKTSLTAKTSQAQEAINKAMDTIPVPSSIVQQAIDQATALITAATHGHVVTTAEEQLIMDTDDVNTATKVWRWNMGGLGYSENGYEGPYSTAITMDGGIVADHITTGTLMADLIKAGRISDMKGQSYWDMDTGELNIVANSFSLTGGKTIDSIAQDKVDSQTQDDVLDKLTNGGTAKGIFLLDGELYVNASYLTTGILQSQDKETFYLDLDNGVLKMKATQLEIAGQSVNDALADAVTGMEQEYYLSSSATYLSGGDWSTTQPAWTQGRFIWNRQHVTYGNGTEAYLPSEDGVCITGNTGEDGTSGENGVGVTSIEAQYYSYSSDTYPPSSYYAWSTNMPAVQDGYYIWCRQKVSYDDSSTTYTDPYCMSKTMGDIAQAKVDAQTQEQIFDKLTNGGEIKGIYMEDGQLYISFTYAKGGELVLGGSGNYRGQLKILDENGNLAGLISNAVFAQYAENGNKAVEIRNNGVRYYAYDSGGAYVGGSAASATRGSGQKGVSHWVEAGGKLTLGYRLSDGGIKSKLWIDSSDTSKTVQMDGTVNATLFSRNTNGGLVFSSGLLTTAGLKTATGTLSLQAPNGKTVTVTVGSGLIETWEVASGSSASGGYAVMGDGYYTGNIDNVAPGIYSFNHYSGKPSGTPPFTSSNNVYILIGTGSGGRCHQQVAIQAYPNFAIASRCRDGSQAWRAWFTHNP